MQQLLVDMDHYPTFGDLLCRHRQMVDSWEAFRTREPGHPTVRALAAAGVPYASTGLAVLSLCLPETCMFRSTGAVRNNPLATQWHRQRHLPICHADTVLVEDGLLLQGTLTAAVLTGRGGLLHHAPAGRTTMMTRRERERPEKKNTVLPARPVYLQHGPRAGLAFLDALQRLTTCAARGALLEIPGNPGLPACTPTAIRWVWMTACCRATSRRPPPRCLPPTSSAGASSRTTGRAISSRPWVGRTPCRTASTTATTSCPA